MFCCLGNDTLPCSQICSYDTLPRSSFTHHRSGTASLSAAPQCCGVTLGWWGACSMMTESSSLDQMIPPSGTVYSDGEGVMARGVIVWWARDWVGESTCEACMFNSVVLKWKPVRLELHIGKLVTVEGMGVWQLREWECGSWGNGSVAVEVMGVWQLREWECDSWGNGSVTVEGMGVWQLREWECGSWGNGSVTVEGMGVWQLREWECGSWGNGSVAVEGMGVWQLREWECDSWGNGSVTVEGMGVWQLREWECDSWGNRPTILLQDREREQSRYRHLFTEGNTITQRPRNALTYCTTKVWQVYNTTMDNDKSNY